MALVGYQAMTKKEYDVHNKASREWAVSVSGVFFIDVEVPCIVKINK